MPIAVQNFFITPSYFLVRSILEEKKIVFLNNILFIIDPRTLTKTQKKKIITQNRHAQETGLRQLKIKIEFRRELKLLNDSVPTTL